MAEVITKESTQMTKVLEVVAKECGVKVKDLKSKSQKRKLAYARMIYSKLMVLIFDVKPQQVAEVLDVHPSTVDYYLKEVDFVLRYPEEREHYENILMAIKTL